MKILWSQRTVILKSYLYGFCKVNSDIFARVLFSRNFAYGKFHENKSSWNGEIILSITDIGKLYTSREFLAPQECLLRLFVKIKFSQKFPDLQYYCVFFFSETRTVLWWYSKTCVKWPLPLRPKISFPDQFLLNAGQKYCHILQYSQPSLSYHLSLRSLFCLFLSSRFTQVLLYLINSAYCPIVLLHLFLDLNFYLIETSFKQSVYQ